MTRGSEEVRAAPRSLSVIVCERICVQLSRFDHDTTHIFFFFAPFEQIVHPQAITDTMLIHSEPTHFSNGVGVGVGALPSSPLLVPSHLSPMIRSNNNAYTIHSAFHSPTMQPHLSQVPVGSFGSSSDLPEFHLNDDLESHRSISHPSEFSSPSTSTNSFSFTSSIHRFSDDDDGSEFSELFGFYSVGSPMNDHSGQGLVEEQPWTHSSIGTNIYHGMNDLNLKVNCEVGMKEASSSEVVAMDEERLLPPFVVLPSSTQESINQTLSSSQNNVTPLNINQGRPIMGSLAKFRIDTNSIGATKIPTAVPPMLPFIQYQPQPQQQANPPSPPSLATVVSSVVPGSSKVVMASVVPFAASSSPTLAPSKVGSNLAIKVESNSPRLIRTPSIPTTPVPVGSQWIELYSRPKLQTYLKGMLEQLEEVSEAVMTHVGRYVNNDNIHTFATTATTSDGLSSSSSCLERLDQLFLSLKVDLTRIILQRAKVQAPLELHAREMGLDISKWNYKSEEQPEEEQQQQQQSRLKIEPTTMMMSIIEDHPPHHPLPPPPPPLETNRSILEDGAVDAEIVSVVSGVPRRDVHNFNDRRNSSACSSSMGSLQMLNGGGGVGGANVGGASDGSNSPPPLTSTTMLIRNANGGGCGVDNSGDASRHTLPSYDVDAEAARLASQSTPIRPHRSSLPPPGPPPAPRRAQSAQMLIQPDSKVCRRLIFPTRSTSTAPPIGASTTPTPPPRMATPNEGMRVSPRTAPLQEWLMEHLNDPYPTPEEKAMLAEKGGLDVAQVSHWVSSNGRGRDRDGG